MDSTPSPLTDGKIVEACRRNGELLRDECLNTVSAQWPVHLRTICNPYTWAVNKQIRPQPTEECNISLVWTTVLAILQFQKEYRERPCHVSLKWLLQSDIWKADKGSTKQGLHYYKFDQIQTATHILYTTKTTLFHTSYIIGYSFGLTKIQYYSKMMNFLIVFNIFHSYYEETINCI